MKKSLLSIAVLLSAVFFACEKEEEILALDEDTQQENLEFKDQPLQGKISGNDWTALSGTLDRDQFILYGASSDNICDQENRPDTDVVYFFLSNVEPGVYELSPSGRVVVMQDSFTNYNVSDGKFEILTVDTANNSVSGRLVAYWDDNTTVNGNFTVDYCFD